MQINSGTHKHRGFLVSLMTRKIIRTAKTAARETARPVQEEQHISEEPEDEWDDDDDE